MKAAVTFLISILHSNQRIITTRGAHCFWRILSESYTSIFTEPSPFICFYLTLLVKIYPMEFEPLSLNLQVQRPDRV